MFLYSIGRLSIESLGLLDFNANYPIRIRFCFIAEINLIGGRKPPGQRSGGEHKVIIGSTTEWWVEIVIMDIFVTRTKYVLALAQAAMILVSMVNNGCHYRLQC